MEESLLMGYKKLWKMQKKIGSMGKLVTHIFFFLFISPNHHIDRVVKYKD